jgi:hypothetical protein
MQARRLGPLALLRLRAEILLGRIDDHQHQVTVTAEERERLVRVASAPRLEDREFLGGFDFVGLDADDDEEELSGALELLEEEQVRRLLQRPDRLGDLACTELERRRRRGR